MTARADAGRERAAVRLGFAAALAAALAFALVARDAVSRQVEPVAGLVAPEWSAGFPAARSIHVASAKGDLTLELEDGRWVLRERADHPVNPAAITTLHRNMTALRFSGARTSDPENHDRLGVADPIGGGTGVRLTVADAEGAPLADWIFGAERPGGVFIRRPDEAQSYAATGVVPDLDAPAFWLDLDFLRLERVNIARVAIAPEGGGPAYRLERGAPAASDFVLTDPVGSWELITAGAANGPGAGMAQLRFLDVRPRSSLESAPAGRHTARTFDGLVLTLTVHHESDGDWATLDAIAGEGAAPSVADAAEALTRRAEGWAYRLPEYAADRLIRPLTGVARPRGDEDAE